MPCLCSVFICLCCQPKIFAEWLFWSNGVCLALGTQGVSNGEAWNSVMNELLLRKDRQGRRGGLPFEWRTCSNMWSSSMKFATGCLSLWVRIRGNASNCQECVCYGAPNKVRNWRKISLSNLRKSSDHHAASYGRLLDNCWKDNKMGWKWSKNIPEACQQQLSSQMVMLFWFIYLQMRKNFSGVW